MSYVGAMDGCGCRSSGLGASGGGCPPEAREISKILNDNSGVVGVVNGILTVLGNATLVIGVGVPILGTVGFISYLKAGCDGKQTLRELAAVAKSQAALSTLLLEGVGLAAQFGVVSAPPGWAMAAAGVVTGAVAGIAKDLSEGRAPSAASLIALSASIATATGTLGSDQKAVSEVGKFLSSDAGKDAIAEVSKKSNVKSAARKVKEDEYKAMTPEQKIAYQKRLIQVMETANKYPIAGIYDRQIKAAKDAIVELEKPLKEKERREREARRKEAFNKQLEDAERAGRASITSADKERLAREAREDLAKPSSKKSVILPLAAGAGAGFLALGPVGAAAGAGAALILSSLSRPAKPRK